MSRLTWLASAIGFVGWSLVCGACGSDGTTGAGPGDAGKTPGAKDAGADLSTEGSTGQDASEQDSGGSTERDVNTDAEPEPQPEPQPEAGPEPQPEAGPEEDAGPEAGPEEDAGPEPQPEAGPDGAARPPGSSCAGGLDCGGVSCCESILVPTGAFPMGRSESGSDACPSAMTCFADEQPEHTATLSSYHLDKFEVTVGRFRKYVAEYNGTPPPEGAGDHHGLGAGWRSAWNAELSSTQADLIGRIQCDAENPTWTEQVGANENKPMACVTWYEAFAFCAWDGGRLATEAEWEHGAAGGAENRRYPWGSAAPDATYAVFDDAELLAVGSKAAGAGRWGHHDLAGSMAEWTFDWYGETWYTEAGNTCNDCVNSTALAFRVVRGGGNYDSPTALRAANRGYYNPADRYNGVGFRCARTP